MSSIQPTDSPSRGHTALPADRLSGDLTLDKTTDSSQSINVCMPSDLDTGRAWKQASQSTAAETGVGATGQAVEPRPCHAGRPTRKHSKPSSSLIDQTGLQQRIVSHVTCHLVNARAVVAVGGCSCCIDNLVANLCPRCSMPRRKYVRRHGERWTWS